MGTHLALLLLVVAPAVAPRTAEAGTEAGYVFAVVPQAPPVVMMARWSPILDRISRESGVPLRMKLYERVEAFQADLAAGAVDLAYLNPVQAIHAWQAARYRPLVRDAKEIRGVLFVREDSGIDSVAGLAGREVAFVGPWSICTTSLRHEFRGAAIVPRYVGTSANAYKNVVLGFTPAGGVLDSAFDDAPAEIRDRLRVIYRTPPMAPHAVVAHPRVPAAVAERVSGAFRALARSDLGAELLGPIHMTDPTRAEYRRDYAPLAHLLDDLGVDDRAEPRR
jgi:phosphonate transport system substrate-binding protein